MKTVESDSEPGVYSSTFRYNGFWHEKGTDIKIMHTTEKEITSSSAVEISTESPYDYTLETIEPGDSITKDPRETDVYENPYHRHSIIYNFDDQTMTVKAGEDSRIEKLILEVQTWSGDGIQIFSGDQEVFEGPLEEGMKIKIYHSDVLYGEYIVEY